MMSCTPEHCLGFTRHPITEPAPPFRVSASPTEPHVRSALHGTPAAAPGPSMVSSRPRPNAWETAGSRVHSGASKATWAARRSAGPSEPVTGHIFWGLGCQWCGWKSPAPAPAAHPPTRLARVHLFTARLVQSAALNRPRGRWGGKAWAVPVHSPRPHAADHCVAAAPTELRESETTPSPLQRGSRGPGRGGWGARRLACWH